MLNENDVVARVSQFLVTKSFSIIATRTTGQRGIDIEALAPDGATRIAIEAKGGTTTRTSAASFGKAFSPSSVYSAVTTAYFCASTYPQKGMMAGIALPSTDKFREQVDAILPCLKTLQIELFWVDEVEGVTPLNHWKKDWLR